MAWVSDMSRDAVWNPTEWKHSRWTRAPLGQKDHPTLCDRGGSWRWQLCPDPCHSSSSSLLAGAAEHCLKVATGSNEPTQSNGSNFLLPYQILLSHCHSRAFIFSNGGFQFSKNFKDRVWQKEVVPMMIIMNYLNYASVKIAPAPLKGFHPIPIHPDESWTLHKVPDHCCALLNCPADWTQPCWQQCIIRLISAVTRIIQYSTSTQETTMVSSVIPSIRMLVSNFTHQRPWVVGTGGRAEKVPRREVRTHSM